MFNFKGRKALVVGAGPVGVRRAKKISSWGGAVRLVSMDPLEDPDSLTPGIEFIHDAYRPSHLDGMEIVVAATDSPELNSRILRDAQEAGIILTNSATEDPREGFSFPASFTEGNLSASVSTNGDYPTLSRAVLNELRDRLSGYARRLPLLREAREVVKANRAAFADGKSVFTELLDCTAEELEMFINNPVMWYEEEL